MVLCQLIKNPADQETVPKNSNALGGGMPIEKKPADETEPKTSELADSGTQICKMPVDKDTEPKNSKAVGSGMQITKMLVDQSEKPKVQSNETGKQKEGTGTQNIAKK